MTRTSGFVVVAFLVLVAGGIYYFATLKHPPTALDDTVSLVEHATGTIDPLANDEDQDRGVLTLTGVGKPTHGTAVIAAGGKTLQYTPSAGYYGPDAMTYTITNASGLIADATVSLDVAYVPPVLHLRSVSATLPEMLAEPPTTIYGSSINVYAYRDEDGRLRKIQVAGHADALTCEQTSSLLAGAMLSSVNSSDFLAAGAGSMSIPPSGDSTAVFGIVAEYDQLSLELAAAQRDVATESTSQAAAEQAIGMTFDAAGKRLEALAQDPSVVAYLATERPRQSADSFLEQVGELQATSGLVRIHDLPFDLVGQVEERIRTAAASGQSSVVTFADLLTSPEDEAVVYVPVLKLGSASPFAMSLPFEQFSPAAFQVASERNRPAVEGALIGTAEKRLTHAKQFLDDSLADQKRCQGFSAAEKQMTVDGQMQTCDKDSCVTNLSKQLPTWEQYCSVNVPRNLKAGQDWQDEANSIIEQVKSFAGADGTRIDAISDGILIDSMLRDWPLPFPAAQEAFDSWRIEGRSGAWQSITDDLTRAGVSRAALSGESLVFVPRVSDTTISIEPRMVIDLRRTAVVIDPALGVTAPVSDWELRSEQPDTAAAGDTGALLSSPATLSAALSSKPDVAISNVIDTAQQLLPPEPSDWKQWAADYETASAAALEPAFQQQIDEALKRPVADDEARWDYLIALRWAVSTARLGYFTGDFDVRLAYALARVGTTAAHKSPFDAAFPDISVIKPPIAPAPGTDTPIDAWAYVRAVGSGSVRKADFGDESAVVFGTKAETLIGELLALARKADPAAYDKLLAGRQPPTASTPPTIPVPVLTRIAGLVSETRNALRLRASINRAMGEFDATGRVSLAKVTDILDDRGLAADTQIAGILNDIRLALRNRSGTSELGPIEGEKLYSTLADYSRNLDSDINDVMPFLTQARFSRDQEAMSIRSFFDTGEYLRALDLIAPSSVPLSLYGTQLKWQVLNPLLTGIPDTLGTRQDGDRLVVAASLGGAQHDVLSLTGLSAADQDALAGALPQVPLDGWSEGDPMWQQLLLIQLPASGELARLHDVLNDGSVRLAALKAMVYACAMPGRTLLEPGGRCVEASGSASLSDRVRDSDGPVRIDVPSTITAAAARQRFAADGAWWFGQERVAQQ